MFTLESNKRAAYYAKYEGNVEVTETGGIRTLTHTGKYSDPVAIRCNYAAKTGNPQFDAFGIDTNYSLQVITDLSVALSEGDLMWIDSTPANNTPANYIVVRAVKTLTHAIYALRERTKNG